MLSTPPRAPLRLPLTRRSHSSSESRRFDVALHRIERLYHPAKGGFAPRTTWDRLLDVPRTGLWFCLVPIKVAGFEIHSARSFLGTVLLCWRENVHPVLSACIPLKDSNASDFIDPSRTSMLMRWVRAAGDLEQANIVDNKVLFSQHFSQSDPPIPLAQEVAQIGFVDQVPIPEPDPSVQKFYIKSSHQLGGNGASSWSRTDGQRWADDRGAHALGWDQLIEHIRSSLRSPHEVALLQERLRNHCSIADLSLESLNTLRLVTLLNPNDADQQIHIVGVCYRMGIGSAIVDNADQGGILSGVSDDGELNCAINILTGQLHPNHPTTQARIEGRTLPDCAKAIQLARDAHRLVPGLITVGWDIALTDRGPVLIEGNTIWGTIQIPCRRGLGSTVFAGIITKVLENEPVHNKA